MVIELTTTTQLSTFDIIKTALRTNSTLNATFSSDDYYEIEPSLKSGTAVPYIHISIPSVTSEQLTFKKKLKPFEAQIVVVEDYSITQNTVDTTIRDHNNAIIDAIETNESSFTDAGYFRPQIELEGVEPELMDSKKVISSTFNLTFSGVVTR